MANTVDGSDGMLYRRPWELTTETLAQYRIEDADQEPQWTTAIPAGATDGSVSTSERPNTIVPGYMVKRRPNTNLNRSFSQGTKWGQQPPDTTTVWEQSRDAAAMVPPKYGWRDKELEITDILQGTMSKLEDPANVTYLDDWSGQNGGYQGTETPAWTIPQGL